MRRLLTRANVITAVVALALIGIGTVALALRPTDTERANARAVDACEAEAERSTLFRAKLADARVVNVSTEEPTTGRYGITRTATRFEVEGTINGRPVLCTTWADEDGHGVTSVEEVAR